MPGISLRNISAADSSQQGREMIKNFSLEIGDREFMALTGPSHAEVSKLIRLIAGLDHLSGGEIWLGDRRIDDLAPKERDVALVSEHYAPYPQLTVRENLGFALAVRKRPSAEIKKRVSAAAELTGLQELLGRDSNSLSIEQRQRLAIASAIALNPKVFLFDHPLSGLDDSVARTLRNEISKLHQRLQVTMIYGTRESVEAMAIGDQLAVLKDGTNAQAGPVSTLYDDPANTFVAEFIGGMNLIAGTLKEERDSSLFVECDQGSIRLRLSIGRIPITESLASGKILLGVHREDIELDSKVNPSGKEPDLFPAIIDHVELMAGGANLFLHTGAHSVVCQVQPMSAAADAGRRSHFRVKLDRVSLFDPISGQKIV
jgi:multiple sugar transport system ATP-binding protein